jgi:ribosomal-protein-alanine N-acetyltransferase
MISATPIGIQPLQGRRVILERCAPEHAAFLQQCYQNNAFMDRYRLVQARDQTEQQIQERLLKEQSFLPQRLKRIEWVIQALKPDSSEETIKHPIGLTALVDYQPAHQRAEFLIGIVSPEYRGTRFSLEAGLLALDFAFNQVQLHKLIAFIYGYNHYAQQNILSFGFRQEGFLHEHIFSKHGFLDLYLNGLTETDFRVNQRLSHLSKNLLGWDITLEPVSPQPLSKNDLAKAKEAIRQAYQS